MADQALAVGGGFLVNMYWPAPRPKKNMACSRFPYSVFTFLLGFVLPAILEPCPYTVRSIPSSLLRLLTAYSPLQRGCRCSLTGILLLACLSLSWVDTTFDVAAFPRSRTHCAAVLFVRYLLPRLFYVQRAADLAAKILWCSSSRVLRRLWFLGRCTRSITSPFFSCLALGGSAAGQPVDESYNSEGQYDPSSRWNRNTEGTWKYMKWVSRNPRSCSQFTHQGYYGL